MKCKGCSKDLTGLEYRDVADWHFCLDCFHKLLERRIADEKPPAASSQCQLCHTELSPKQGSQLLGMQVCEQCKQALLQPPEIKMVSRPEQVTEPTGVEQVPVDIRKTIHCDGCNRQIPERGSKELDDKRYCPDCYQKLPSQKQVAKSAEPETGTCQACQKVIAAQDGKVVSGFLLCQACLKTDPDTALEIARARHQQVLAKIKQELQL